PFKPSILSAAQFFHFRKHFVADIKFCSRQFFIYCLDMGTDIFTGFRQVHPHLSGRYPVSAIGKLGTLTCTITRYMTDIAEAGVVVAVHKTVHITTRGFLLVPLAHYASLVLVY